MATEDQLKGHNPNYVPHESRRGHVMVCDCSYRSELLYDPDDLRNAWLRHRADVISGGWIGDAV